MKILLKNNNILNNLENLFFILIFLLQKITMKNLALENKDNSIYIFNIKNNFNLKIKTSERKNINYDNIKNRLINN